MSGEHARVFSERNRAAACPPCWSKENQATAKILTLPRTLQRVIRPYSGCLTRAANEVG